MADEEAGVDRDTAVEVAQPLAEGAPVPGQARLQRRERHALDPRHHPRDVVGVLRRQRGQREAAVPAEHGGHAVQRRGAGVGVPEELGVVVGVQVDEAGRHQQARGVDDRVGPRASPCVGADGDDAVALDDHVGPDGPAHRCRRPPSRRGWSTVIACPRPLLGRPGPAHLHPLAGERLHPLGAELDAEARLLPPAHRRVHVDGRDPVRVHEDGAGLQPARPRRPPAPSSLLHTEAHSPKGCRWPRPPPPPGRRRGSPAAPGRTAPRARCRRPAGGATTRAGETK